MTLTDRIAELRKLAERLLREYNSEELSGSPFEGERAVCRAVLAMADFVEALSLTSTPAWAVKDSLWALDRALAKEEKKP